MPATTEDQNDNMEEIVPKRGRGRPKKVVKPTDTKEKAVGEPAPKRGRRPAASKKAAENSDDSESNSENPVEVAETEEEVPEPAPAPAKRGRGRAPGKTTKKTEKPAKESEDEDASEPESAAPAAPAKGKGRGKKAERNGNGTTVDEAEAVEDVTEEKSATKSNDAKLKIVVEHCKSCHTYRRKADDILDVLRTQWPNIEVDFNPNGPKKGAFEFNLVRNDGSDVNFYSGLKKGPPRKLKFPEPDLVVESLKKVYVAE